MDDQTVYMQGVSALQQKQWIGRQWIQLALPAQLYQCLKIKHVWDGEKKSIDLHFYTEYSACPQI